MMASEITKKSTFDLTKIYFGSTVHLAFARRELVGFQSWKLNGSYSIELTFRHGAAITAEYDERAKWERVISLVEDELSDWHRPEKSDD
jgi:hypothetical protein